MMLRRAASIAFVLAAFGALAWPVPACSSFDDEPPEDPPTDVDATTCSVDLKTDRANCGKCGTRCAEKEYCVDGACVPGCPQPILYVSPTGKETNDGCSPETSKATIGGAIARIATQKLLGHEVHVCRGTYAENVELRHPVTLRGGYECSTFQRTSAFGMTKLEGIFAEGFDHVNDTRIEPTSEAGLRISGAEITRGVIVEGFTIVGRSSGGTATSTGITIDANAAPTIRDCDVFGGKGDGMADLGMVGIAIDKGASPLVTRNRIVGGNGTAKKHGSIGVYLMAGAGPAIILSNEIRTGAAKSPELGGDGIHVTTKTPLVDGAAIVGNSISCDTASGITPCFGVWLLGGSADVVANRISLGSTECTGATGTIQCSSYGIRSEVEGRAHIRQNRVHGGIAKGGGMTLFGVSLLRGTEDQVVDNMVDPGTSSAPQHQGIALHARGKASSSDPPRVQNPVFAHNTVLLGDGIFSAGFYFDNLGITNVRIDDNIVMGTPKKSVPATAIFFAPCTGSSIASLRANAFLGTGTILQSYELACDAGGVVDSADITSMEAKIVQFNAAAASRVRDNVAFKGSCPQPQRCTVVPTCDTGNGCLSDMLDAWDPSYGTNTLFSTGWRLGASTPCAVARGGSAVPEAPRDIFDIVRTDPPSIGAHEHDGICAPP